jgi:hypothetical protein
MKNDEPNYAFVYACVAGLFADMMNTDNVGNGFRWYNFPRMASTYVKNQMFLQEQSGIDAAEELALNFAKELIERAGVSNQ